MSISLQKANEDQQARNLARFDFLNSRRTQTKENPIISNVTDEIRKLRKEFARDEKTANPKKTDIDRRLNKLDKEKTDLIENCELNLRTIFLIGLKELAIEYWIEKSCIENPALLNKLKKALDR